jgi:hypothetical protein
MKDLSRLHRRITLASVNAVDILDLDQSYQCAKLPAKKLPMAMPMVKVAITTTKLDTCCTTGS